jgi:hypothetical protein
MRIVAAFLACAGVCAAAGPEIAGCPVFTPFNIWNVRVDKAPVAKSSTSRINTVGGDKSLKADFGQDPNVGIPFDVVEPAKGVKKTAIKFEYRDESDKVVYPLPLNPTVENGANSTSDRHVIIVDKTNCILYELFNFHPTAPGQRKPTAAAGAVYNLRSDQLRPDGWTAADAAGLPMFAGLVRYDEVASGEIRHALRFTVPKSQRAYVWPARHFASKLTAGEYMPMGTRLRLKATVDITKFSSPNQVILKALKAYGMILADNGSAWYFSGSPDKRWNDADLKLLGEIKGSDFEEVDTAPWQNADDSAEIIPESER